MPDPALQGLYGIRVAPYGWPEVSAAVALGLILAILIGLGLWLLRSRRISVTNQQIVAAQNLPPEARAIVLARLLQQVTDQKAPGPAPWSDRAVQKFGLDAESAQQLRNLYAPGSALKPEPLERALSSVRSG